MSVFRKISGVWVTTGPPHEYLCTTETELPTGVEGDRAYSQDTHKQFVKKASTWIELGEATGGTIPAGLIALWHGLIANIPSGWVLCDGANGTPDLRSKFVKGAAAATEAGDTGGAATHTHADHAALSHAGAAVDDHASHTHAYTEIVNHTHPVTDPGHTHVITELRNATTGGATTNIALTADTSSTIGTKVTGSRTTGVTTNNPAGGVASGTTAGPGAALSHSVTQPSAHAAQSHSTVNSEPAYFTVLFIMKS